MVGCKRVAKKPTNFSIESTWNAISHLTTTEDNKTVTKMDVKSGAANLYVGLAWYKKQKIGGNLAEVWESSKESI